MKRKLLCILLALAITGTLLPGVSLAAAPKTAQYGPYTAATVVNDGDTVNYTMSRNNQSLSDDQLWLAVNVAEDGQAFQMDFSAVGGSCYIYVYGADSVQTSGYPTSSAYLKRFSISSGVSSRSFKAVDAGVYYVLLQQSGYWATQYESSVTVTLLDGDANENNDTWQTATQLTENVDVTYTLSGGNDVDWFRITTDDPSDAMRFVFSEIDYTVHGMRVDLYAAQYDASGETEPEYINAIPFHDVSRNTSFRYKTTAPGVYYLRVKMDDANCFNTKQLKLRYETVPGDNNECLEGAESNDVWQSATPLTENISTLFTLNAGNDEDWFRITTTTPDDAIKIVLSNFDYTVSPITAELYDAQTLQSGGTTKLLDKPNLSSVSSGTSEISFNYKTVTPGDYYLRITPYQTYSNGYYVDTGLRLRYETVPGDSYENNDTQAAAAAYPQDGYEAEFTLNGENDVDWFYFETATPGETVTVSLRGFETDYSNAVKFFLYREGEDGSLTRLFYEQYISRTWSRTELCAEPGKYCICISSANQKAVENTLRLKIDRRAQSDSGEPNDTWQTATSLSPDVPQNFNLPGSADIDWFMISPEAPYQTLDMSLQIPAGGSLGCYIYSGEELNLRGDSAGYLKYASSLSAGTHTVRWQLGEDSTYYIKLVPGSSGVFAENGTITCSLIAPDAHEPNGTWQSPSALSEGVTESFTMPAVNDTEWFAFTVTEPNQTVELALNHPGTPELRIALFDETDLINQGNNADYLSCWYMSHGSHTLRRMLEDAGTYYVRISFRSGYIEDYFDSEATLSYRLIEPDAYENNNTWQNAAALSEEIAAVFTMPAPNDTDWFCFTTDRNDQTVELVLDMPQADALNYLYIYTGTELQNKGSSAGAYVSKYCGNLRSGRNVLHFMLGDADTYYVELTAAAEYVFDGDAALSYRLIGTDAYERNNDWQTATALSPQTPVSVTLPAYNDYDWFLLDTPTDDGDTVTVTLSNQSETGTLYVEWYSKGENDSTPGLITYRGCSFKAVTHSDSVSFTVYDDDDYYLCLRQYGSDNWFDQPISVSYRVTRQDTPVTGVSISPTESGSITIFEGKTLSLSAVITPANAANQNVSWTSSNESAVTVDGSGKLTAVAPGASVVTATTADGGHTANVNVTVAPAIPVTGVTVSGVGVIGNAGESEQNPKNLSLHTSLRLTADVQPATATERDVTWTVSDGDVLYVTSYGKVYAVGSGSAYVTVTTADGSYSANFYFNVPDESYPVTRITLSENLLTLYMGEDGTTLTPTVFPSYATNPGLVWSSSDESIAAVDQYGCVTPVSVGYAVITAAAQENPNAVTCTCQVSVQPERTRVTGLSFPDETINVGIYAELDLASLLNIAPDNATVKTVTWSSSNKLVASVSRRGIVSAMNIGTAVITATSDDGGHTASITICVSSNAAFGDVNNDGDVDAGDAMLILRYSVGLIVLTDAQQQIADVNGDGESDVGDAILVLRYDAGLIDTFPAEDD